MPSFRRLIFCSLSVKFLGRENALGDDRCFAVRADPAEEAAAVAFVANGAAVKFHAHEQRVAVAIHAQFAQHQLLAAGFALGPQLLARAAVKRDEAGLLRERQRLAVHESQHQDFAIRVVLHDRRDQPVLFFEVEFHFYPLEKQKARWCIPRQRADKCSLNC